MQFETTFIQGLIVISPRVFKDERGYFFETYNKKLALDGGINASFVQDNESFSKYGTLRGLHFQKGESAQAKLVRVGRGRVLDVAVDLRLDSPTFGKHFTIELNEENKKQLFVPRGFAHGFVTLSEEAVLQYKCDNFYNKEAESGVRFDDIDLGIDWLVPRAEIIINERDLRFRTLKELLVLKS